MTPLDSEILQRPGVEYLQNLEELLIIVSLYGESSFLAVCGSSANSLSGVFVVLFSASVVIFVFVFSFPYSST